MHAHRVNILQRCCSYLTFQVITRLYVHMFRPVVSCNSLLSMCADVRQLYAVTKLELIVSVAGGQHYWSFACSGSLLYFIFLFLHLRLTVLTGEQSWHMCHDDDDDDGDEFSDVRVAQYTKSKLHSRPFSKYRPTSSQHWSGNQAEQRYLQIRYYSLTNPFVRLRSTFFAYVPLAEK